MREFYRDFYGCTASITTDSRGCTLTIVNPAAPKKAIWHKTYTTKRGALIAMGKLSDCWHKAGGWK